MDEAHEGRRQRERLRFLKKGFAAAFLFFVGLFIRYQVLGSYGGAFVLPAFSQRQKGVAITLARGNILDRHGVPLHYPVWGSALARFPADNDDPPVKVARERDVDQAYESLSDSGKDSLVVVPEEIRYGPGSLSCHVVGHIRPNAYMDSRDNIGESGLEKTFQSRLAGGTAAWSGVVVTAEGEGLPGTGLRIAPPSEEAQDLYTTIDAGVQRIAEEVFDDAEVGRGAAVILDAYSSQVLAMASRPAFDQNHPELSLSSDDAPFVNRAISAFAPGSVFKPLIAGLALDQGCVTPDEVFICTGKVRIGDRTVNCGSSGEGHGTVTVTGALSHSCNSALIEMGLRIPAAVLSEFIAKCGFGTPTGLPLPDEASGVIPWGYNLYSGDIANTCIGQGRLSVTPIQMACFFAAIARDGVYQRPSLIAGAAPADEVRLFSRATAVLLQESLLKGAREGTGRQAWVPSVGSAGKTGTAETGSSTSGTHAWFCGFTPVIAPKYVIAVFVEEGGDGPSVAAPLFRQIASRLADTHGK